MKTLSHRLLLGITGSIAAYKTPELIRKLKEQHYEIKVVLTAAGKQFVTPLTLQAVSQNPVYEQWMDAESEAAMNHIELARWPEIILIAPATAHFIAKCAQGFADDLLSTLCLATQSKLIIAPAMNRVMWENPATQENVQRLKARGCLFLGPDYGAQACGDWGVGRFLDPLLIVKKIAKLLTKPLLKDRRVLITAGPTQEALDPVRYLSNRSSGKMGFALAKAAVEAGAEVTLISGPVALSAPAGCRLIRVKTAEEMFTAAEAQFKHQDIFISAAAVADYRITQPFAQKIKKSGEPLTLTLAPTLDILGTLSQRATTSQTLIVGFAAETHNIIRFAEEKRIRKGVDLMIVNDVSQNDIGFESEHNAVTVLSANQPARLIPKTSKDELAQQLIELIAEHLEHKQLTTL
jgi:phosphopantothenoylcysteine decarboxylase / phosphopantothenate---cysteine ligase